MVQAFKSMELTQSRTFQLPPAFALRSEGNGYEVLSAWERENSCHSSAQSKSVFCISLCQPLATLLYICQWAEKASGLVKLQH